MRMRISAKNMQLTESLRELVERRMRYGLSRFSGSITDVNVKLSDESGPNGPPTRRCQVSVRLRRGGSARVLVDALDSTPGAAAGKAAVRIHGAVARRIKRRRFGSEIPRKRAKPSARDGAKPPARNPSTFVDNP